MQLLASVFEYFNFWAEIRYFTFKNISSTPITVPTESSKSITLCCMFCSSPYLSDMVVRQKFKHQSDTPSSLECWICKIVFYSSLLSSTKLFLLPGAISRSKPHLVKYHRNWPQSEELYPFFLIDLNSLIDKVVSNEAKLLSGVGTPNKCQQHSLISSNLFAGMPSKWVRILKMLSYYRQFVCKCKTSQLFKLFLRNFICTEWVITFIRLNYNCILTILMFFVLF